MSKTQDPLQSFWIDLESSRIGAREILKRFSGASMKRQMNLNHPDAIHQDLIILEQNIKGQIGALEESLILYRRLVQDIQSEMANGTR